MSFLDQYQTAMSKGYYFDRRIDLKFYDNAGSLLYVLNTPKDGYKPSITVKGTFIEGSYSINNYVSVQNMLYTIDINSVSKIECHMYYSGMDDNLGISALATEGKTVLFDVLYADQEKEPPNRAIRFQCTTAADCREMYDIPIVVSSSGTIQLDLNMQTPSTGSGSKDKAKVSTTLIEYLKQLATARNNYLTRTYIGKKMVFRKHMTISVIECPKALQSMKIAVSPSYKTFGGALKELSSFEPPNNSDPGYTKIKVSSFDGRIIVTAVPPSDWEQRAEAAESKTDEQKQKFFDEHYSNDRDVVLIGSSAKPMSEGTSKNPIRLNFVKAAFRSENLVSISMIYDDRISPGKFCAIASNAIMGKATSGTKLNSRLTSLPKNLTVMRITGTVDYEFSTTEMSGMTFTGPVVDEGVV